MLWLQQPNQSHVDNLSNVRSEASRHFRNKKKEYLKAKIDELETNSKISDIKDLYRGTNNFKKSTSLELTVKDEKCILVADCHSILLGGGIISLGY